MVLVFLNPSAHALFTNYNTILLGDQAAGMGGAYAAMSGDVPASCFYNPAGLSWLNQRSASAAVGIYKKFDTQYGNYEDFTKASLKINQGFFRSLPSSSGSVIRFEDFMPQYTMAFSILVPDYDNFKGDIHKDDRNNSSLNFVDESLWVGWSASRKLSKSETFGFSLYYTARNYVRTAQDTTMNDNGNTVIYSEDKAFVQNNALAIIGYQKILAPKWRFGASLRMSSIHVAGNASYFKTIIQTNPSSIWVDPKASTTLGSNGPIPPKLTFGLAFHEPEKFTVSADLNLYGGLKYSDIDDVEIGTQIKQKPIWNGAIGFDVQMRKWLKGRMGWFTNFSPFDNPDPSLGYDQPRKVDQLGFAANVALSSGPITYTFGGYYTGGRGYSLQRVDQQWQKVSVAQQIFTMLVGTSFNY